jgi:CBS domain-containing protein
MARYGSNYGRDRWTGGGGYGQGGYGGGQYGGGMNRGRYGGEYGGMGSDANYGGGSQAYGGHSGFGSGGGAYDNDFDSSGYGGYGYGGGSSSGGGYGADSSFSGASYEGDWSRGRGDSQRGGYGYGGGQGYGGGAGYTGGGYGGAGGYGGGAWSGGGDADRGYGERGYTGGSGYGGGSTGGGQQGGDELRRMRAADVMTDNPECVTPETSLADAARKMRDLDVGIIPVVESESSKRLRGVLTDRDIAIRAVAEGRDANTTRVMEVMTTQVETCNKNDSLRDVLGVMEREQVRRVPITDREGRLVGIIAQADVATDVNTPQGQRHFADTVEQISEPGNPRGRGSWGGGGRSSQSRGGGQGGGLMGAVRSAVSSLGHESHGRTGGGDAGSGRSEGSTSGNNDPRAMNDPGSENV